MFGHYRRKRKRKEQSEREKQSLQNELTQERERQSAEPTPEEMKTSVQERFDQARKDREMGRKEGRQYAEEVLGREVQGLDPHERSVMQYEAQRNIERQHQNASRKLLGDQSSHGIVGKGGVGYAQQADLQRIANESQGQATRDIEKLNSERQLKNLAAMFNIEQGEATQTQLDRQMAIDELELEREKKRQRKFDDEYYRLFSRI